MAAARIATDILVLYNLDNQRIAGYYTLAATAIQLNELPTELIRKFPEYPPLPATLLGRSAVDESYEG